MTPRDDDAREALVERLHDVQHDLGKHIRLPLALLPREAGPEAVRAALTAALLRTRSGPSGLCTARALWTAFRAQVGDALAGFAGWAPLLRAVERALAWEPATHPEAAAPDRALVEAELAAVGTAIRALTTEVERG